MGNKFSRKSGGHDINTKPEPEPEPQPEPERQPEPEPEPEPAPESERREEELQDWIDKYHDILEMAQNFQTVPLTEEEENWVRFTYLLVDEGTIWVRGLLMGSIQEKGNTLRVLLEANRQMLTQTGFRGAGLSPRQKRVMFPTPTQATNSADEFDFALLVRLIGILNLLPTPYGGWDSDKEPIDIDPGTYKEDSWEKGFSGKKILANNLLRMRLMRDNFYNNIVACTMTTEEFDVEFPKLKSILISFGAMVVMFHDFKKPQASPESCKYFALRVTTLFSGDRHDVEQLMEQTIKNHEGIQLKNDAMARSPIVVTQFPRNETPWEDR